MTVGFPRLGIISALHQEQAGLIDLMQNKSTLTRGMRNYTGGRLGDTDTVCVLSRVGKVAAAATAATLIEHFGVTHIVFTGVAGAMDESVQVGDIVVADALVQHDMNASPLFPRFEIPLLGQSHFASDLSLTEQLLSAAQSFVEQDLGNVLSEHDRTQFHLERPRVHRGLIGSGDEFIHNRDRREALRTQFPDLLAVEMEGGAVAQVCFEFGVPFAVIRTITDGANEGAPHDFMKFIERVASRYAFGIVRRLCG